MKAAVVRRGLIIFTTVTGIAVSGITFTMNDKVSAEQDCPGVTDQSQLRRMEPVPDGAGKVFPLVVIHGITGTAEAFNQTVSRSMVGAHPKPDRSMLDSLAGVPNQPGIAGLPHTRVYSFEYTADSLRWFTEAANGSDSVGERFASVIDCLYAQHGVPVMVLAHSMGGLVTRWAANQTLGPDGQPKIGKVVTLGTPYLGSSMAMTLTGDAVDGLALTSPLLSAVVWWCGRQGTNTGNATSVDCDLLSSLTSQAGRALRLNSPELSALAPWPEPVDVTTLAGSIFLEGSLFGARTPRQEIGDAVVGLDSATANGDETFIEECDPFADETPIWIRVFEAMTLRENYPNRLDQVVKVILDTPCYHGGLMASVKQNIEVLGEFNDWISAQLASPLDKIRNAEIPAICTRPPGRLENGLIEFWLPGSPFPGQIRLGETFAVGDIDGDGFNEVAVNFYCNGGGVGWPEPVVIFDDDGAPIGAIEAESLHPDFSVYRSSVRSIRFKSGFFVIESSAESDGNTGCCHVTVLKANVVDGALEILPVGSGSMEDPFHVLVTACSNEIDGAVGFDSNGTRFLCNRGDWIPEENSWNPDE